MLFTSLLADMPNKLSTKPTPGRGESKARTSEVSCIWYSLLLAACWITPPALATAGGLKLSAVVERVSRYSPPQKLEYYADVW